MEQAKPYLTTFQVADVKAEKVEKETYNPVHLAQQLFNFPRKIPGTIIDGTSFSEETTPVSNGFVRSVTRAYNRHHHLILRPDDVWLSIITQFSFYLNARSEEFRSMFVKFEGKKVLYVRMKDYNFASFITKIESLIDKNIIDSKMKDWILPNFSTTTYEDRLAFGVVFMATMQKYFDFRCYVTCGIPSITLDGTADDWQEICRRIEKLDEYKLQPWTKLLRPILNEFALAKTGRVNSEFWNNICYYNKAPLCGVPFLNGWITAFCYYDFDGMCQARFENNSPWPFVNAVDIPASVVQVDVSLFANGKQRKAVLMAGSMGIETVNENSLQPRSGWAFIVKQ